MVRPLLIPAQAQREILIQFLAPSSSLFNMKKRTQQLLAFFYIALIVIRERFSCALLYLTGTRKYQFRLGLFERT